MPATTDGSICYFFLACCAASGSQADAPETSNSGAWATGGAGFAAGFVVAPCAAATAALAAGFAVGGVAALGVSAFAATVGAAGVIDFDATAGFPAAGFAAAAVLP